MPFIYELAFDGNSADSDSYSDWEEDYVGGNSGPPPGTYPSSNWNLNLDDPATNQGANGNDGGAINIGSIVQTSDDGGTSSDPNDVGDGNIDAGESFTIQIDDGNGGFNTLNATVDYFFTPNANADTSLMVFVVDNGDGTFSKYAYNMGNGDPAETDAQKIPGGRITEGMTNNGHTFDSYEDRVIVCFVRGTNISTPTGDKLVENIAVGDPVLTADNGVQIVRWTGSRRIKPTRAIMPIRIKAGALGDNLPNQDLLVSPAHRMLVSGWRAQVLFGKSEYLVAAKDLVNDSTIVVAHDIADVEYFHILFDKHEIVSSNGTPSESFHPNVDALGSLNKEARMEIMELFPNINADGHNGNFTAARPTLTASEATLLN